MLGKIDTYLDRVRNSDGSYGWGDTENRDVVSTEHMIDIINYYNLKHKLNPDDTQAQEKLNEAINYLNNNLYKDGKLLRGKNDDADALDTYTWMIQTMLVVGVDKFPDIKIEDLVKNIENHKIDVTSEEGKKYTNLYTNLYSWSTDSGTSVSFEWTLQVAVSYRMLSNYYKQQGNDQKAEEYAKKSQDIIKDVENYSKDLGFEDGQIPCTNIDGKNYSDGWNVYKKSALCTLAQRLQVESGSFFNFVIRKIDIEREVIEALNYAGFKKENGNPYTAADVYRDTTGDYIEVSYGEYTFKVYLYDITGKVNISNLKENLTTIRNILDEKEITIHNIYISRGKKDSMVR